MTNAVRYLGPSIYKEMILAQRQVSLVGCGFPKNYLELARRTTQRRTTSEREVLRCEGP